jgi:hypothetical protein
LFGLWNEHRLGEGAEHFDEDVELDARDLPQLDISGVYRGLAGFKEWAMAWLVAWEDMQAEPLWMASREEQVVVWLHMRMVGKGSGVPVELNGGWGFWFREGKISRVRIYADERKARDELGVEIAQE